MPRDESGTGFLSPATMLGIPLAVYLLWTLVTYLLEGRVHLLISGDPVGRLAYAVVANLLIGTVFTLYVMSVFRRRGGISREYFGFQPAKRTPTIRNRYTRQSVPTLSRTRASSVTQVRSGSNGCSPGGCTVILERIPEDYPTLLKCFTQPQKSDAMTKTDFVRMENYNLRFRSAGTRKVAEVFNYSFIFRRASQ